MHVQLVLDAPHTTWTNLDFVRGKVVLRLFSTTPIASILVKLEGESRTRLKALPRPADPTYRRGAPGISVGGGRPEDDWAGERPVVREEMHKILYKVSTVFPDIQADKLPSDHRYYTLGSGEYEYPFSFKIPFNNTCMNSNNSAPSGFAQLAGLKSGPNHATAHVKKALPPTLTAFPGLAEVRYYLKATVKRKEFYKENPRVIQNLNFFPIEPPRPQKRDDEVYARRQHSFVSDDDKGKQRKGSMNPFRKSSKDDSALDSKSELPTITVDARLPSPAILTCNDAIPLRILVRKTNNSAEKIVLQSLHIQLSGNTHVKAGEIVRDEASNWVILTTSNMNTPLRTSSGTDGKEGEELVVDAGAWLNKPLPNTVAPSFETCNISRKYDLEIQVGIGYGKSPSKNTVVIPLHHPVTVFSGISPPQALLDSMGGPSKNAASRKASKAAATSLPPEKTPAFTAPAHVQAATGSSYTHDSAIPSTSQPGPSQPARPQPQAGPLPAGEEAPPPSYEDAIAEDLPPLDGPRREYNPPPLPAGNRGFESDRKGRRDS